MGRPALCQIKVALVILVFVSCDELKIPSVYGVEADLVTTQGITRKDKKVFSGYSLRLFANGDTAKIVPYIKGKAHGVSKEWYENRRLKEVRIFENGYKVGEHKGWYEDESLRFIFHFKQDAFHGNVKEWQPNGILFRDFNYKDGQEDGPQKMWESDGRLKANYVVRRGRMYGLVGTKNCLSTMP